MRAEQVWNKVTTPLPPIYCHHYLISEKILLFFNRVEAKFGIFRDTILVLLIPKRACDIWIVIVIFLIGSLF